MNENTISIASEIIKAKNEPATGSSSIASQILAEKKRRQEIEGKLAEDQNKRIPPELQAEAIPIAKSTSLPVDVARRNLDVLKAEHPQPDLDKAKADAPSYGKVLQDNAYGPIAQSAVSEMPYFERVLRSYGQAFSGGFEDLEASDIGYRRMQGTATPQDIERLNELKEERKKRTDFRIGSVAGFFQYPVQSAPAMGATVARTWDEVLIGAGTGAATALVAGQLGPQVALPEEVVTVPGAAIAGARIGARVGFVKESYEQLAGDAYNEALEALDENGNPLDEDSAYAIATFAGGVGAVAELLPFEKALDTMPFLKGVVGKEGARRLAGLATENPAVRASLARMGRILKVGGAEAFTEVVQEAYKLESIIAAGGVTDAEGNVLADQRLERYGEAAVGGFAGGTTLGAAGEAVTATVEGVASLRAKRVEAKQQALVELGDKIRTSKVNGMSPETVVAHAKQMDADGAAPQMSAPAEALVKLFQSEGLTAEQVQAEFPTIAQAIDEAAQTGAEVTLNAETVVKLARLEKFADITGDIRTSPEELTANEAKQADVEFNQMLESMSEEDIAKAVNASVHKDVMNQLVAAGTDPKVAETQAKLFTSVISNLAERTGMQPDQLLKRYGLTITGNESVDTAAAADTTMMQDAPGFRVSNPGGSWLAEKQARADADLAEGGKGIRGADTASVGFRQPITLPVEMLSQLRGVNDEVRAPGNAKFDDLARSIDEQGYTNENPVVVVVNHRGEAFLNEGNTRVAVAKSRNVDRIAATVYWMNGAEQTSGAWSPEQVLPAVQPLSVEGETLFQSSAPADFLASLNAREQALVNPIYTNKVPSKKLKGNEAAARWLESNFKGKPVTDFTKEIDDATLREIGNVMAAEAVYALQKSGNAFDWYSEAMQRALRIAQIKWPVLGDDTAAGDAGFGTASNARFVFTYIMAVTSQNLDVAANAAATNKAFDEMLARVKAGDFTMSRAWGTGDKQAAMGENFAKFGPLIDAMPGAAFPEKLANLDKIFRMKMPVSEWVKRMKAEGVPYSKPGQTAMSAIVYGSSLLGPKIGNGFWQNLNGNFSPLTIDLWMRRTWGRLTGKSIGNEAALPAQRARLKASVARSINSPELDLDPLLTTITERRSVNAKMRAIEANPDIPKKEKAAQLKKLKARINELEDMAADFRGIPVPEAWKKDYDTDNVQLAAYAKRLLGAWDKEYKKLRVKYGKKVPAKMQPTWARAAKRLKADLTTPLDQVANGTQRRQIETAVGYAQETLTRLGYNVTTADLQAILWYPEKELWGALTTALAVDEDGHPVIPPSPLNESYDTVFTRILNAEGYDTQQGAAGDQGTGSDGGAVAGRPDAGSRPDGSAGQDVLRQAAGGGTTLYQSAQSKFDRQVERARSAFGRLLPLRDAEGAGRGNWVERRGSEAAGPGSSRLRVFDPRPETAEILNGEDIDTPPFVEHRAADYAAQFFDAISASKAASKFGASVYVYSQEEYAQMRLFTTEDGAAGFALKSDGDIVSVFSTGQHKNVAYAMLNLATDQGGTKLDCFDTVLPKIYAAAGFAETGRDPWNEEYKPEGWDYETFKAFNDGRPDVVYMAYDPAAANKVLEQRASSTTTFARGSISFGPARDKFKITLTGKADLSTFMHESAHYFLEVLQDLVEKGDAPQQIMEDLGVIRQWAGVPIGGKIERVHHEKFARGFEAYLMEGRAPSADLQSVFNRFRAWLVFIYKKLTALNVELTDDVRGVMDRLVASDREIAEARTSVGWSKPLPKEALYLSDDEYDRYVEAWNKANEAQQREVDARLMLEAAREAQDAWKAERQKVFDEEKAKLAQTRGYRAWKLLSQGEGLEAVRPGWSNIKIDPASVPSEWRRDAAGLTAPVTEGGLPLETVAEILGFDSGEQMLSTIAGAKFANRELPRQVQKIMDERHGALDMTALADLAMQAVHSDKTQEVLLTEFRAMSSRARIGAAPVGMTKWMAAQAEQRVLALTRRQLDPTRWRRAQLKAAEQSATAAAKGDVTKAAIHKRQQMMAAAMYKATVDGQKRIDTIRKKLQPFTKNDRRAKLGKAGDLYLDGIDEILEGVQLKQMSAASVMKLDRLAKLVEEADKNGEPLVLPDKLRAMLGKKNFADMTLEELEGVHDSVMNIWHLAKLKNELKARNEKRTLEEALTEMEANAQAALGDPKVTVLFTKGWTDKAAATMRSFRAGLTKMEFLFGWLDGKPDGGLMHRLIYQPIADANKAKYDILKRFHETLIERMRNMPTEQKARWESKRTFMGNPTANGATIIAAALNLGNQGNKQKLLEGYGWNEQRLMAEINGFMTKADWDFVQHVWNEIDTLWPKIEATTKAATGLAPEKVVASPIVTPFGTYAGGYYPVVYDPEQTEQQFKNQQETAGLFTNNYTRPTLGDGFTKARVQYSAPILLELSVISQHLAEVVHYVTHYEAVTQADKITRHPRFQAVVKGHMGNEFYRTIRPWLQDVARDQDTPAITKQEPFAKAMRHLRGGVSIAAMGYNIFTGLKQLIGIVQSLDAVGPKYWLSGLSKAWLSPNAIKNWKFAFQNSQELEPLVTQLDRDIKMINDAYAMEGTLNIPARVASWAFKHIGWLQAAVNVATWHGAYEQDLARNGGDHEKAVMHADAVVRQTQSAGAVKDLSPIQRGSEINRAVSMFYSWFNVLYNRFESIARETRSIRDVPKAAARVAILVMMSSMIEEASRRAYEAVVDNYEDDEEEPGFILSVLLKSADTAIGAIPLGRAFFSAQAATGGMTPDLVPVAGVVDDYWRTLRAAYDIVAEGEAPSRSEIKTAVRTVSIIGGVPLSGPYNFLDEIFGEAVFGEGKKTKP